MQTPIDRRKIRQRIRYRVRKQIQGTAERPRLAVFRSHKHIYAQAIDDTAEPAGRTIAQASTLDATVTAKISEGGKVQMATAVGSVLAQRLREAGVETAVFDRGGFLYHGRIKAVADGARSEGLKF
jgi:large subunit ribosomal protein L18